MRTLLFAATHQDIRLNRQFVHGDIDIFQVDFVNDNPLVPFLYKTVRGNCRGSRQLTPERVLVSVVQKHPCNQRCAGLIIVRNRNRIEE